MLSVIRGIVRLYKGDNMNIKFKNEITSIASVIQINEAMPPFIVVDSKMNEIKSDDVSGMKLILTLPSVDTSVCSLELAKFIELLKDKPIHILSISMDLPFALDRWCQRNAADNLIAASDFRYHGFAGSSGLLMREIGLFSRSVLLIDSENKVRYLEIVEDVSNEPNYQKALEEIEKLLSTKNE